MLYAATIKLPKAPTCGSTALAATGRRHCTNPNCEAKDCSSHWVIDCYWEGGGKEGQFPPGFGQRKKPHQPQANQTTTNTPNPPTTSHTVLVAQSTGENWNSSVFVMFHNEDGPEDIPPLKNISSCNSCPIVFVVDAPLSDVAAVSPLTFLDSGANNHFFRDRRDFTKYESVPYCMGKSALASEGDFAIVGKGTVICTFEVGGRKVTLTFKNALHAPSLSASLISISQFDRSGYYSLFGGGEVIITMGRSGKPILHGRGSAGMYVLDPCDNFALLLTLETSTSFRVTQKLEYLIRLGISATRLV